MSTTTHKPDEDLEYGASFHDLSDRVKQIENVLAQVPGEADGADWYWLCLMKNKRYGLFWGGCDYTGWDCQSNMEYREAPTPKAVLSLLKENDVEDTQKPIKQQLLDQIDGKQPYALREP